jgi:hypothetical protein
MCYLNHRCNIILENRFTFYCFYVKHIIQLIKIHVLLKLLFHTTIIVWMNIVFIQSIDENLLSIFLNIKRTSSSEFDYKKLCQL